MKKDLYRKNMRVELDIYFNCFWKENIKLRVSVLVHIKACVVKDTNFKPGVD